ncbi:uncharacterized protein C8A04DRAFT_38813 [Dichotomopilus funicola]|uniref:Rhodopsin domain-containing protein n=1 Tax=Dichotomopilus funicola TaxID=1934379 RepID=A0AAN6UZK0_9PEZI|nr:hypothetical protein C8A04DRAFT_38813 [Dichotomopilus funicola]
MADAPMPPDENRGPEILAVCGALVGLALVVVLMRLFVRYKMVRHVGMDDWVIIGAMVVMFVEMMIIIPEVQLGAGRHVQYIKPPENVTRGLHLNFVTQPLCLIALCLTKVSVGFFLLRLTPSPRFRWIVIGTMIFTVLSATGNFLTVFFQCRPLALIWDSSVEGTCIPPSNLKFAAFFNSSVAVLTDVLFALLPIPILWNVQMNWKVKAAVATILSVGIFAAVAAIVKITYLGAYGQHGDFLWDSADITIWTTVEINVAIIAASVPCLKPLFKSLFDGSSARYRFGGSSNKYAGGAAKSGSGSHGSGLKNRYFRNGADDEQHNTPASSTSRNRRISTPLRRSVLPAFEMYGSSGSGKSRTGAPSRVSATGSEESILPQEGRPYYHHSASSEGGGGRGIIKTSTVQVEYDEERRRSGGWGA